MATTQLPQELFADILFFLCLDKPLNTTMPAQPTNGELGACSLVCRFWAIRIRTRLFGKLVLHSYDRALEFIALAKSEVWPSNAIFGIGMYASTFEFEQSTQSPPWIHLVLHCMPSCLLRRETINSRITFSGTTNLKRHHALPESLPPSTNVYYPCLPRRFPYKRNISIFVLALKSMTFRHFKDTRSLLFSMCPEATYIECRSLRWLDLGEVDTVIPRISQSKRRLFSVEVYDCTAVWPFISVFATTRTPKTISRTHYMQQMVYVMPMELFAIIALVKCIFEECKCALCEPHQTISPERLHQFMIDEWTPEPGGT